MRTTVTLDSDVARRLKELVHLRKMTLKEALNASLRCGLNQMLTKPKARPFHTVPEDMGVLPYVNYDNVGELLEIAEGLPRP